MTDVKKKTYDINDHEERHPSLSALRESDMKVVGER